MSWYPFENGSTVGTTGSEAGTILVDDEHRDGARITLEADGSASPFAITCGIYGRMVHTRFFEHREEAEQQVAEMKRDVERLLAAAHEATDRESEQDTDAIGRFLEKYP